MFGTFLLACLAACHPPEASSETDRDTDVGATVCTDLDCDGWPDLVIANNDVFVADPSRVYWGGPDRYQPDRFTDIPEAVMTKAVALADLDRDGDLDVVMSRQEGPDEIPETESYVIYTTATDPWAYAVTTLPTMGAHQAVVADFDDDGWPDLWFSNHQDNADARRVASYLYWGGPDGFSEADRSEVQTQGAFGAAAADLDADGRLDLAVSNYFDGTSRQIDSFVLWGDGERFASDRRTWLPTIGARAVIPHDVTGDGWLDLLFVDHFDGGTMHVPSYLYEGGPDGFSVERRVGIPSIGPHTASLADFDADGRVDLVFSNQRSDPDWTTPLDSEVFLGLPAGGFGIVPAFHLDTNAAAGQVVGDLDHDGWIDVAFANFARGVEPFESYVYWGSPRGFDQRTALPTDYADGMAAFAGEHGF